MELQPGPPFSHSTRGLLWGLLWASTNLRTHGRQSPVPGRAPAPAGRGVARHQPRYRRGPTYQ